jgi:hypothetical protein
MNPNHAAPPKATATAHSTTPMSQHTNDSFPPSDPDGSKTDKPRRFASLHIPLNTTTKVNRVQQRTPQSTQKFTTNSVFHVSVSTTFSILHSGHLINLHR